MSLNNNLNCIIKIFLLALSIRSSHNENIEPRALELSVPWRPMQMQLQIPPQQLISVASFDTTSKEELVHIAQHNAQILKHFNQPITHYHNQNGYPIVNQHQHQQQQQQHHHHHHHSNNNNNNYGHTPMPKYMTTPLLLSNVSPNNPNSQNIHIYQHNQHQKPPTNPYAHKSDISSLNFVIHTTPKIPQSSPNGGNNHNNAAKFANSFPREPIQSPPSHGGKSTSKPHPVMNKLQAHLAMAYRQKQPIAATSNRLEQFTVPNHLFGTFIQFGQAGNVLRDAKTKFVNQLASHPHLDTQLNGLLHAGIGSSYGQTLAHIKNLQKLSFLQQQNKMQQHKQHQQMQQQQFNQIHEKEPKKAVHFEKTTTKSPITASTPLFPHLPPSVLTPFFQQVQQQQNMHTYNQKPQQQPQQQQPQQQQQQQQKSHQTEFSPISYSSFSSQLQLPIEHKKQEQPKFKEIKNSNFNEVRDEYSKNLVPPPPSSSYTPFLPTVVATSEPSKNPMEILNKYNINPSNPLQDANRFSYNVVPKPSPTTFTPTSSFVHSTTTTTTKQPQYNVMVTPLNEIDDSWSVREKYVPTEKPNVFKNLYRTPDSEYKQHKLMHPGYTGIPIGKVKVSSSSAPFLPTPLVETTVTPFVTHSFFTIEDAIADPTLPPPQKKLKNKIKIIREEENKIEEPQIVTVTPFSFNFRDEEDITTTTYPPFIKNKPRRRRPKPTQQQQQQQRENDYETTEKPLPPTRNRTRYRLKPTDLEEIRTTIPEEFTTEKRIRKIPTFTSRNKVVKDDDQDKTNSEQFEAVTSYNARDITTIMYPTTNTDINQTTTAASSGGQRTRFRHHKDDNSYVNRTNVTDMPPKPTKIKTQLGKNNNDDDGNNNHDHLRDDDDRNTQHKKHQQQQQQQQQEVIRENNYRSRDEENKNKLNFKLANIKPISRSTSTSSTTTSSSTSSQAATTTTTTTAEPSTTFKNEYLNRPRFSIKDYRNKMNRTTMPTPEYDTTTPQVSKVRFPTRTRYYIKTKNDSTPANEIITTEKPVETTKVSQRPQGTRAYTSNRFSVKKTTTTEAPVISTTSTRRDSINRSRIKTFDSGNVQNKSISSTFNNSSLISRRPPKISLRQRIQNFNRKKDTENTIETNNLSEELKTLDVVTNNILNEISSTTEGYKPLETSIMKIASKDQMNSQTESISGNDYDLNSASSDYSQRVVELTLSANKDKAFKTVNKGLLSRKVPGYFTLATEDPILPIEAFFPQVKKNT